MKIHHLIATSLFAASSVALFATAETDRRIEDAAKSSYNYRTLLEDKVSVSVNDGIVTLTGMVADKDSKAIAEDTVNNLPGVAAVDNQITLDPALKEHSDALIAWKIRYQLLVRANVSNRDTKVYVKDGVVMLTGTATTLAEKDLVGVYATDTEGVKSVRNEILILAPLGETQTVAESMDDASITSHIKYALLTHRSTSALKTGITTNNGVVVITGIAANDAEKSLVGKLATNVRGVKSVTNDMTVKS
ncbi:MAG: BON domain-containing protein [Opitutaceae bacterium]|nr:BON domain-containing protein [Opitutaceae bacterium]